MPEDARNLPPKATAAPLRMPGVSVAAARSHRWRLWAGLGAILVVAVGLAWWLSGGETAPRYVTAPVGRGIVSRSITASGMVNPVVTVQVGSYVSGVIQDIKCDYNTQVKAGQLCAKIDPRPYQTVVEQARANLASARAQLVKDQANLLYMQTANERAQRLLRQGIVSQDAADSAKSAFDQARADITLDRATIDQRQASLNAAQVNLDYTNIMSPVDGTVVSRNVNVGQTVAASFQTPTLFLIATDLTKMQVDTNVSESDIGGVKLGNKASFTVQAYPNRPFIGVVSQVRQAPITVQNVVTYDAVLDVENPDLSLKPGMTATARVVTAERTDVLRVPDQALHYTPAGAGGEARAAQQGGQNQAGGAARPRGAGGAGGAPGVWVLRDGKPVRVAVTAGLDDDAFTEITGGELREGDQVILSESRSNDSAAGRPAGPRLPRF